MPADNTILALEAVLATEGGIADPGAGDVVICASDRGVGAESITGFDREFFVTLLADDVGSLEALIAGPDPVGAGDSGGFDWTSQDAFSFTDTLIRGWVGLEDFTAQEVLVLGPLAQDFPTLSEAGVTAAALSAGDAPVWLETPLVQAVFASSEAVTFSDAATAATVVVASDAVASSDALSSRTIFLADFFATADNGASPPATLTSQDAFSSLAFAVPTAAFSLGDAVSSADAAVSTPSFSVGDAVTLSDTITARSFTLADFCAASDAASTTATLSSSDTVTQAAGVASAFAPTTADAFSLADMALTAALFTQGDTCSISEVISGDREALDNFVALDTVPLISVAVTDAGTLTANVLIPAPIFDAASLTDAAAISQGCFDTLTVGALASVPFASITATEHGVAQSDTLLMAVLPTAQDACSTADTLLASVAIFAQDTFSVAATASQEAFLICYEEDVGFADEVILPDILVTIADHFFTVDRCKGFPTGALPGPPPYVKPRRSPRPVIS